MSPTARRLAAYRKSIAVVIKSGSLRLLWQALAADGGTNRGLVLCNPPRFVPDAENRENFYKELLATIAREVRPYTPVSDRVLVVSSGLGAGGAERQIANTLTGLRAIGVDVHYLGLWLENVAGNDFHGSRVRASGVPVTHLVRRQDVARKGLTLLPAALSEAISHMSEYMLEVILNLVPAIRETGPEVVHSWLDETNIQVGLAAAIAGTPRIVLSCRSVAPTHFAFHQEYMRPAYRALLRLPNVTVLNNSGAGTESYARWLDVPADRFTVLRNGVDLEGFNRGSADQVAAFRQEVGIPPGAPVVGSVFRIGPEKRPRLWLDACARTLSRHPEAHFLIVGDGALRAEIEGYAEERGLADRLHLPGVRQDVNVALSAMDVFLLTSDVEGLPNVLIEAQWLGVPVVTTRAGGSAEAVDHGRTGFVADGDSPEEIGQLLSNVLDDAELRADLASAGRDFVAGTFGMPRMISETMAQYTLGQYRLRRAAAS